MGDGGLGGVLSRCWLVGIVSRGSFWGLGCVVAVWVFRFGFSFLVQDLLVWVVAVNLLVLVSPNLEFGRLVRGFSSKLFAVPGVSALWSLGVSCLFLCRTLILVKVLLGCCFLQRDGGFWSGFKFVAFGSDDVVFWCMVLLLGDHVGRLVDLGGCWFSAGRRLLCISRIFEQLEVIDCMGGCPFGHFWVSTVILLGVFCQISN